MKNDLWTLVAIAGLAVAMFVACVIGVWMFTA